ncbi:hypothetical protein BDW60DRAFT_209959 [Aspergillus nidulans var. acristatus]
MAAINSDSLSQMQLDAAPDEQAMATINSDSLSQMQLDAAPDDTVNSTQIGSLLDVQNLVSAWATAKGESHEFVGDIQLVAKLVRTLELHERETLLAALEQVYTAYQEAMRVPGTHEQLYGPLPRTLATYMVGEVARSPKMNARMNEDLANRTEDEKLRYKIKVVRNSFLWLDELMMPRSHWVGELISANDAHTQNRMHRSLRWLTWTQTRKFCEGAAEARSLTDDQKAGVEELWQMFVSNRWLPIECAFCLARLDPDRSRGDEWSRLFETVESLQWR